MSVFDLSLWRGRRVIVTGGSGFIGQHVVDQGVGAGVELHNFTSSGIQLPGVVTHRVDLRQQDVVLERVKAIQPDAILHLAAGGVTYGVGSMADLIQVNVSGLQGLLEAAAQLAVPPQVVIAGSWFEYSPSPRKLRETDVTEPVSPYSVTKVAANVIARHYAQRLPITVLRLFAVYGVGEKPPRLLPYIIQSAAKGEVVEVTGCEQVRDYIEVGAAAEAFWRALSSPPAVGAMRILNVGTGEAISLKAFILLLADLLAERGMRPDIRFGVKPYRVDENMYGVADTTALTAALGWTPPADYREGLQAMIPSVLSQIDKVNP
jgi:nucleoside-diphosphate-sugar epimerase